MTASMHLTDGQYLWACIFVCTAVLMAADMAYRSIRHRARSRRFDRDLATWADLWAHRR